MKNIIFFLLAALLLNSCEIDNYTEAGLTVTGKILDNQTNELVESGGDNAGSVVKFYQNNSAQARILNTLPDGTFTNSRFFAGSYRYVAEGPFQPVAADTPTIVVNGNTEIDIKVIPNVRLTTSIVSNSGTSAVIKVSYEKVPADQTLTQIGLVWSKVTQPNVFTFTGGNIISKDVQSLNLTAGDEEFTVTDLIAGTKYFVRAAARTNAPGNYYNYSTQIELQQ